MTKQVISTDEFDKKVEIEKAYLVYMDRLSEEKASEVALATVSRQFTRRASTTSTSSI